MYQVMLKTTMYLHEDVMKQQKVVVGYASEGWHTMLEGEIILKPCNFYRKVMMLLCLYFHCHTVWKINFWIMESGSRM